MGFKFWVFESHITDLSKTVWNDLKRADKVELLIICSCEVGIYFSWPLLLHFAFSVWVVLDWFLLPVRESGSTSGYKALILWPSLVEHEVVECVISL